MKSIVPVIVTRKNKEIKVKFVAGVYLGQERCGGQYVIGHVTSTEDTHPEMFRDNDYFAAFVYIECINGKPSLFTDDHFTSFLGNIINANSFPV